MSKRKKDPLLVAFAKGESYTWTIPEGGNLASMRAAVKHEQTITMASVTDVATVQVGDIVYVKWHKGYIFHLVGEIEGNRYLIVNSVGKVNGWVNGEDILGRVTEIIDPPPRPPVPDMFDQLEAAYRTLIEHGQPVDEDAQRLLSIVADMRWYAERLGAERWQIMPRSNVWSFEQNLWWLTKRAKKGAEQASAKIHQFIDAGKKNVGLASEIITLFEPTK